MDPKFQTLLAFMTRLKFSIQETLSLLESLHNVLLSLLSLNMAINSVDGINHWPPHYSLPFVSKFLPIDGVLVSLVDIRDSRRGPHDVVLNTCCRIMISIGIMHGSNTGITHYCIPVPSQELTTDCLCKKNSSLRKLLKLLFKI